MHTRSLLTTLACAAVLAGAGAETAFAASDPTASPTPVPGSAPPTPGTPPTTAPNSLPTTAPTPSARPSTVAGVPTFPPPPVPTSPGGRQISVVPSGAPNTGVPAAASDGHGEAAAIGASLVVLLGGSGTLVLRRRLKGRG